MHRKSWKSRLDPKIVKQRREQLDSLLALANADFTTGSGLENGISAYSRAIGVSALKTVNYLELITAAGKHIASRIEVIIDACQSLWSQHLWKMEGSLSLTVIPKNAPTASPERDIFSEEFSGKRKVKGKFMEQEKARIDLALLDVIRDLDLRPSRFRKCPACLRYFYRPTSKEKNFCSPRCAGTMRQRRYIERKKDKEVIHQES